MTEPVMAAPPMSVAEIHEAFELFDSWEDRYRFVIDLGRELPALPAALRTEEHLVRGCQSQVWLVVKVGEDGIMRLAMDSDAHIVRGLIAIVLAAYDGQTPQQIAAFDIQGLFDELDLLDHLSATRGNGLRAMVDTIVAAARRVGGCRQPVRRRTSASWATDFGFLGDGLRLPRRRTSAS